VYRAKRGVKFVSIVGERPALIFELIKNAAVFQKHYPMPDVSVDVSCIAVARNFPDPCIQIQNICLLHASNYFKQNFLR
jgi:hypothetical protein